MALDEARGEREYLYGRWLGIADYIEEQAMRGNGDGAAAGKPTQSAICRGSSNAPQKHGSGYKRSFCFPT